MQPSATRRLDTGGWSASPRLDGLLASLIAVSFAPRDTTELFSPAPVHRSHPFSLLCPVPDNIYISFKPFLHNAFEKLVISAHPQRATASTLWWARLDSNQRSQKRLIYSQVELPLSDLPISVVKVRIGYEANLFGMLRLADKSPTRVGVVKVSCNPFTC